MKRISRTLSAVCASFVAFSMALPNAPQVRAQTPNLNNEVHLVVKIIAEHPEQCPSDNLRAYTYIYIEGKGVPDANGYIFATAHATTDIFILSGPVVSLAPRHHEMTYTLAIRLEQFPPVPIEGISTTYSLDSIPLPSTPPAAPDTACQYVDGDGTVKTITGSQEFAFRMLINTLKGALYGLGGMQRNAIARYPSASTRWCRRRLVCDGDTTVPWSISPLTALRSRPARARVAALTWPHNKQSPQTGCQ